MAPPLHCRKKTVAPSTSSKEFKSWFKESKAVDGEEKPLQVWHGSPFSFDEFQPGNVEAYFGSAVYFTDSAYDLAEHYAFSSLDPLFMEKGTEWFKAFNEYKSNIYVEFDGYTDVDIVNVAKDFVKTDAFSKISDAAQKRLKNAIEDSNVKIIRDEFKDVVVDAMARIDFETDGAMQAYPVYLSIQNPLILDEYGKMKGRCPFIQVGRRRHWRSAYGCYRYGCCSSYKRRGGCRFRLSD